MHSADEDTLLDSGEGQRLGQGSSLRGSPSALTGADLTLPRGNLGSASGRGGQVSHSSAISDPNLPTYQASLGQVGEADDDTEMGTQHPWDNTLRNSIEADGEDEAIDLPDFDNAGPGMQGMTSVIATGWDFGGLERDPVPAADDDVASDVAQGDSSSAAGDPFASDNGDMEPMLLTEPSSEFMGPDGAQDDFSAFEEPPAPIPRDGRDFINRHAVEVWEQQVHTVPADLGDDQASEQVAEIHVGDEHEQQRESPDA